MKYVIDYGISYVIALVGVALFFFFHLPLPWLLGPIFACLLAALCGLRFCIIEKISDYMRTVLGVAVGATITLPLLANMLSIWSSLLLVLLMVVVIAVIGVPYFFKIWKYDFATSYYASMPGGLQDMLLFGQQAGANVRTLSLAHATRVLLIVVILPLAMAYFWDADLTAPPGDKLQRIAADQIVIMIIAALVGWQVAKRIGMLGAAILGPLLFAAILSIAGILQHRPPAEAIWTAQYFLGLAIGVKYVGITIQEFQRDIVASFFFTVLIGLVALLFFFVVTQLDIADPQSILLAYMPGGQAEMTVIALVVGADLGFVIAHHILRIFFVILIVPLFATMTKKYLQ